MGIGKKMLKKAAGKGAKSGSRDKAEGGALSARLQDKAAGKSKSGLKRAAKSALRG